MKQNATDNQKLDISRFTQASTIDFLKSIEKRMNVIKNNSKNNYYYVAYRNEIATFISLMPNDYDIRNISPRELCDARTCFSCKNSAYKDLIRLVLLNVDFKNEESIKFKNLLSSVLDLSDEENELTRKKLFVPFYPDQPGIDYFLLTKEIRGDRLVWLKFDTKDAYVHSLFTDFLNDYLRSGKKHISSLANVTPCFIESLGFVPSSPYDFTVETLYKQMTFYNNLFSSKNKTDRYNALQLLKMFYIFVAEKKQTEYKTFTGRTGVSLYFLKNREFLKTFLEGYRTVLINKLDPVPNVDKWALSPNGIENESTSDKETSILRIDFSEITDPLLKNACKDWFWNRSSGTMANRDMMVKAVISFLCFRENLRKDYNIDKLVKSYSQQDIDVEHTILVEEVINFTNSLNDFHFTYANRTIYAVRSFCDYLVENNVYNVEKLCFEYLKSGNRGKATNTINATSKEDTNKLMNYLEKKANESIRNELLYIVFCLNIITPLRLSEILDLKTDCIEENRKGSYFFRGLTKTSNGQKKKVGVTHLVKKLIDRTLELTSKMREEADENFKKYLFLCRKRDHYISDLKGWQYRSYLKKCEEEIGIEKSTARNIRKRYMTNVIEKRIENNISRFNIGPITGHATPVTTEKNYVRLDQLKMLKIGSQIIVGGTDIEANITDNNKNSRSDNIVNDNCGYCSSDHCMLNTATCLLCKKFKTSPEFIDDFYKAIDVIDEQMNILDNSHDLERLQAVKKLYQAYATRLEVRKSQLEVN